MSVQIHEDKIIFEAIVAGLRTLKDKSISITLHTQELKGEEAGALFSFMEKYIHVIWKPQELNILEKDMEDLEEYNPEKFDAPRDRSPSKRLRDIIFRRWDKEGRPGGDFDYYYKRRIDKYISHEKQIIDKP